jgi:hypothetical protein
LVTWVWSISLKMTCWLYTNIWTFRCFLCSICEVDLLNPYGIINDCQVSCLVFSLIHGSVFNSLRLILLICSWYEAFSSSVITLDWTCFDVDVILQVGMVSLCMILGHVDFWLFYTLISWVLNIGYDLA